MHGLCICLTIMQNTFSVATNKEALCRLVEVTTLIRSDARKANDRKTDSDIFASYSPLFVMCMPQTNCRTYAWSVAQWLERRTRDRKVPGSSPGRSGGWIFFFRVNFLCRLLFWYPFYPRVTAIALKIPRSFHQKCKWQVTAKHKYILSMRLWMK